MNKLREYYLIIEEIEEKINDLPKIMQNEYIKIDQYEYIQIDQYEEEILNRIKAMKKIVLEKLAIEESKRGGKK